MHVLPPPHERRPAAGLRGTCVGYARTFGDLNDPESDIAKRLAEADGGDVLYEDLGLNPSLYYIGLKETEAMPVASAIHRGGNVVKPYER